MGITGLQAAEKMNSRVALTAEEALGLCHQEITAGDTTEDLMIPFPVWQRGGRTGRGGGGQFWGWEWLDSPSFPEILRDRRNSGDTSHAPSLENQIQNPLSGTFLLPHT